MQRLSSHEVTRARQAKRPDRRGEIDLQRLSVQQATQATDIAKAVSPHGQLQKARPALPVRPSSPRGTPRGRSRSNVRSNEGGGRGIAPPPRRPNALGVRIVGDRILGREVLDRLIALLRVQYPGRTLGLDRTRERPAQVRTNDLAAETEFGRQFLRAPELLCTHVVTSLRCVRCHDYRVRSNERDRIPQKGDLSFERSFDRTPRHCLCTPPCRPPEGSHRVVLRGRPSEEGRTW